MYEKCFWTQILKKEERSEDERRSVRLEAEVRITVSSAADR